jgi:hypothetical protein
MEPIKFDALDSDDSPEYLMNGEPFTGEVVELDGAGRLLSLITVVRGEPEGATRIWHPDGTKKFEETVKDGRPVGVTRSWHINGVLAEEKTFDEQGQLIATITWNEAGQLTERSVTAPAKPHGDRHDFGGDCAIVVAEARHRQGADLVVQEVSDADRSHIVRGAVNAVTYGIDVGEPHALDMARRRAAEIVDSALFAGPPASYYEPIVAALRSEEQWQGPGSHRLRGFLSRLVAEMDQLRPWPERTFEVVREEALAEVLWTAPVAGFLDGTFRAVATRLRGFSLAYWRPDGSALLIISLRSGAVLGLRASSPQDQRVAIVAGTPGQDVVDAFTRAVGRQADRIAGALAAEGDVE